MAKKNRAPPLWVYSLTCLDSLLCAYCIWCLCTCSVIMDLPSQFFFPTIPCVSIMPLLPPAPCQHFFFFNTFINSYMYGSRAMTLRVYFPPVWSVVGSGCGRERKNRSFLLSLFFYLYRSYFATFLNFPSAYARLAVCRVLGRENSGEIFFFIFFIIFILYFDNHIPLFSHSFFIEVVAVYVAWLLVSIW